MKLKMELISKIITTTKCERLGDKQLHAHAKASTFKRERLRDNEKNTCVNWATPEPSPEMTKQNKIKKRDVIPQSMINIGTVNKQT